MFTATPFVDPGDLYAIVWLTGEVDLVAKNEVRDAFEYAMRGMKVPHLIVDVSEVTFMDSTGLSALATAHIEAEQRGGSIGVVGASDRLRRLFHLVRLDDVITVWPEGVRLLRRPDARPGERSPLGGRPRNSVTADLSGSGPASI